MNALIFIVFIASIISSSILNWHSFPLVVIFLRKCRRFLHWRANFRPIAELMLFQLTVDEDLAILDSYFASVEAD